MLLKSMGSQVIDVETGIRKTELCECCKCLMAEDPGNDGIAGVRNVEIPRQCYGRLPRCRLTSYADAARGFIPWRRLDGKLVVELARQAYSCLNDAFSTTKTDVTKRPRLFWGQGLWWAQDPLTGTPDV